MKRFLSLQVSFFALTSMMMSYYAICQGFTPTSSVLPSNNPKDIRRKRGYGTSVSGRIIHHMQRFSPASQQQEQHTILQMIRGGALRGSAVDTAAAAASNNNIFGAIQQLVTPLVSTPSVLFRSLLVSILSLTFLFKILDYYSSKTTSSPATAATTTSTPQQVDQEGIGKEKTKELQLRFLPVFWMLRLADWLQGPYFYEVYASKVIIGGGMASASSSLTIISRLFLTGFASTALFGPISGQLVDTYGRKRGTLAFCLFYMIGALSTKSNLLPTLLLGRIASGIGTSLLFSAPESWLVGDAQRMGQENALGSTFGLAYAGDSIVAIIAGQLAALAASYRGGPTGPFELSILVLAVGAFLTSILWQENVGSSSSSTTTPSTSSDQPSKPQPTIQDALRMVLSDPKIASVGAVQSLFEAAMYIFVLQWPPAISSAIAAVYGGGASAVVPYGTIFSCFMACCLMGATLFSKLNNRISNATTASGKQQQQPRIENSVTAMLLLSTIAVGVSAAATTTFHGGLSWFRNSSLSVLSALISAFFAFEIAVGFYFPSIGTLRSKYIPDSHRSVIMNLFGIPLNALVVSVFLSINSLGIGGALSIATAALSVATIAMFKLMLQTKPLTSVRK